MSKLSLYIFGTRFFLSQTGSQPTLQIIIGIFEIGVGKRVSELSGMKHWPKLM
jgi:hypothetical protein